MNKYTRLAKRATDRSLFSVASNATEAAQKIFPLTAFRFFEGFILCNRKLERAPPKRRKIEFPHRVFHNNFVNYESCRLKKLHTYGKIEM